MTIEAVTSEAANPEDVTSEAATPEAMTSVAVTSMSVTPEVVTSEAVTSKAVNSEAVYKSYPERWSLLATVAILNVTNYSHWISFAAVSSKAAVFYQEPILRIHLQTYNKSFLKQNQSKSTYTCTILHIFSHTMSTHVGTMWQT
jgi:hypothetical protein